MKNRVIYQLAMLLLMASAGYSQHFEGKILYSNKFSSRMQKFTDEQLGLLIGTTHEYFIKGGNYKSIMNGQSIAMQLYDYSTNRVYNKTPKSDTLYWFDASINTDGVLNYEVKKNAEVVLGFHCDALILKTRTGSTTLYYSNKFLVDAGKYNNHHYSNWSFFVSKTGSLPLKTIIESNQFIMESIAIAIEPLNLKDEYFTIDPKSPIQQTR